MKTVRLTPLPLAAFVSPQIPLSALSILLFVTLPPFYATEMGLGLVAVSQAFFFGRIWDVVLDPMFGLVSDRLRPRWGRRPWIVASLPVLIVTVYLLFLPKHGVTPSRLLFTLLVFYVGWTFATLSFYAWGSELTDDYNGRSRIQGWYQFAVTGGVTLVLGLLALIERHGGSRADQMAAMGLFTVVLLPITFLAAIRFMGEREVAPHEPIPLRQALSAFRSNKPLRFVLAAALLAHLSAGVIGSLFVFFAKNVIEVGGFSSTLLLIFFAAAVVGIPVWTRLALWVGKHRAFVFQAIYNLAVLPLLIVLPHGQFWMAALGFAAVGFNYGTPDALLRAMMSDVIDVDRLAIGRNRSGIFFSFVTLSAKFGAAAPVIMLYPILAAAGFKTTGHNSPHANSVLAALFVLAPMLCNVGGMLLMWRFPIDRRRHAELQERLAAEHDGASRSERTIGATLP